MGATNTHFVNPNGLPADNHYSTARDLATMFSYGMRNPLFEGTASYLTGLDILADTGAPSSLADAFPTGRYALLCFVKEDCPTCGGGGKVLSINSVLMKVDRFLRRIKIFQAVKLGETE